MSERTCAVESCNGRHLARGLCQRHYTAVRRIARSPRLSCRVDGCEHPDAVDGLCITHDMQKQTGALSAVPCAVDGCSKPSTGGTLCAMHGWRRRVHGDVSLGARPPRLERVQRPDGYFMIYAPDHPLTGVKGMVQEHRKVLYDSIGDGDHPCAWCGLILSWRTPFPLGITVDHLNNVRNDNRPENLVPACNPCNVKRGHYRKNRGDPHWALLLS